MGCDLKIHLYIIHANAHLIIFSIFRNRTLKILHIWRYLIARTVVGAKENHFFNYF